MSKGVHITSAIVVMIVAAGVFVIVLLQALVYSPSTEIVPPPSFAFRAAAIASTTPSGEYPARITIPSIGINAAIQARGLVAGNRMAAPTNFTDVGWFEYGVVPGTSGVAVLYGHLDNGLGLNGVFKNLSEVVLGDAIQIQTKDGHLLTFTVTDIETYLYQSIPPNVLGEGSTTQDAQISLITCAGTLIHDPVEGFTYDHRLVITGTYESETL